MKTARLWERGKPSRRTHIIFSLCLPFGAIMVYATRNFKFPANCELRKRGKRDAHKHLSWTPNVHWRPREVAGHRHRENFQSGKTRANSPRCACNLLFHLLYLPQQKSRLVDWADSVKPRIVLYCWGKLCGVITINSHFYPR